MGKIIGDTGCPACIAKGRDRTFNHLILFEDGGAYCPKCGHKERPGTVVKPDVPVTNVSKDTRERKSMSVDIKALPIEALRSRLIDKDVAEHYGVRTEYDEVTGEQAAHYYPLTVNGDIVSYKVRKLPKEFYLTESIRGKPVQLIGQTVATGGKKLLVTEGQDDMLAAFQMLYRSYPKFKPSVVSLPNGANLKPFSDNEEFLNKWEEIIFCPDNDKAGKELVEKIASIRPDVKFMSITEKDANDMLRAKKGREFVSAYFKAAPFAPEGFVTVDDVFEEATAMPTWGKPWPWPTLTAKTYGRRLGEGAYFGAGVKIGKSEAVNQIAHHIIINEGKKVALFKFEEKPSMTVRRIAGKVKHKQFHIPDGDFTQEELIDGVNAVKDGLVMYGSYGMTEWDKVKLAIRHAVVVEGCEDIILDPLTRLTPGMDSGETNTELERIADEISTMAKDLGFFYYIFCHLKAPLSGKPHEEGGKVHSNQFTGSRAMMRAAYYFVGIERNKMAEDETERDTSRFVILEDRAFGNSGSFDVFYDRNTGDYLEPTREFS